MAATVTSSRSSGRAKGQRDNNSKPTGSSSGQKPNGKRQAGKGSHQGNSSKKQRSTSSRGVGKKPGGNQKVADDYLKAAKEQWSQSELEDIWKNKKCLGCGNSGHRLNECRTFKSKQEAAGKTNSQ